MASQARNLGDSKGKSKMVFSSLDSMRNMSLKPYDPSTHYTCPRRDLEERRELLGSTKVIHSLSPSLPTMEELGIRNITLGVFKKVKLNPMVVMGNRTHPEFVKDFFGTLEIENNDGIPIAWKFWSQGKFYRIDRQYSEKCFGFSSNGIVPNFTNKRRLCFWRSITGMREFDSHSSPKHIGAGVWGVWKYIHRLVAVNINSRNDEGFHVTREDLDVMIAIQEGCRELDLFTIFSHRFLKMKNTEGTSNKALGCASLLTEIAKQCFSFEENVGTYRALDIPRLIRMKLIDHKTKLWIHASPPSPQEVEPVEGHVHSPVELEDFCSYPPLRDPYPSAPSSIATRPLCKMPTSSIATRVQGRRRRGMGSSSKNVVEFVEIEDSD